MIKQFVVHTKTDKIVALSYLSKHDWNVGAAFESFNKDNKIKSITFIVSCLPHFLSAVCLLHFVKNKNIFPRKLHFFWICVNDQSNFFHLFCCQLFVYIFFLQVMVAGAITATGHCVWIWPNSKIQLLQWCNSNLLVISKTFYPKPNQLSTFEEEKNLKKKN